MVDIIIKEIKEPLVAIWISNAWEPYHSDKDIVSIALEEIKLLGFNTIVLDSKGWEDFFIKYKTGKSSPYIAMQEYMQNTAAKIGLYHMFLSLWAWGDNWYYMGIREYPPIYGESVPVMFQNKEWKAYKYWSSVAQSVMVDHHEGLLKTFSKNHVRVMHNGIEKLPIISMHDPNVVPSFDTEGIQRYRKWLRRRYGKIDKLNRSYKTNFKGFDEITPRDYWVLLDKEGRPVGYETIKPDDFKNGVIVAKWVDNQLWRVEELLNYFKAIREEHTKRNINSFLVPTLQQWKIFFNEANDCPGGWTTSRAIDPWKISHYVDTIGINTVPIDCYGRPDTYVVSAEASIVRSTQNGGYVLGGFFLGRHWQEDIYKHISPAEVVGTLLANGAKSLYVYGYNGLDDGGMLFKMPEYFKESVKTGLEWFKKVSPNLTGERKRDIAILFPLAMSLLTPITLGTSFPDYRMDVLGWYKHLTNLGYMVDFLHPDQIIAGELNNYFALIMPCDYGYCYMRCEEMEKAIVEWVTNGGVLLHGPGTESLPEEIRPVEKKWKAEVIEWKESIMPESINYSAFEEGEAIANYVSGEIAISKNNYRKGEIYSFGFNIGYAFTKQAMNLVTEGIKQSYPIHKLKQTPVEEILRVHKKPNQYADKEIEVGDFGREMVIVNHSPVPRNIPIKNAKETIYQYETGDNVLLPHSAVFIFG